jgi:hypothetical protein
LKIAHECKRKRNMIGAKQSRSEFIRLARDCCASRKNALLLFYIRCGDGSDVQE